MSIQPAPKGSRKDWRGERLDAAVDLLVAHGWQPEAHFVTASGMPETRFARESRRAYVSWKRVVFFELIRHPKLASATPSTRHLYAPTIGRSFEIPTADIARIADEAQRVGGNSAPAPRKP